ncbi:MAG TPA: hypothetical protein VKO43_08020 [Candidatus Krumholzibacteriaceae bacterium]|nr:hypothetical protein [Candidatus Krumholzibacteriaceae bacterium]
MKLIERNQDMFNSEEGIGLIEIIMAILIFAIGITAAMRILPVSNFSTTKSRNITFATNLAREKIEELSAVPFDHSDLASGSHTDPENPLQNNFTRSWNINDNVPVSGMKEVNVTVSFNSRSSDSSATLTTYITSRR